MSHSDRYRVSTGLVASAIVLALALGRGVSAQQNPPTFREAVDVIEVAVRVVTDAGVPIPSLAPNVFEVTIDGKKRRVVSADFVRFDTTRAPAQPAAAAPPPTAGPAPIWLPPRTLATMPQSGRIYVLYVDADSFDVPNSRNIMTTAASFVGRLQPNDQVGLFVFPIGAQTDPTTDHALVLSRLAKLVGTPNAAAPHEFALRPSELVVLSTIQHPPEWGGSPRPDRRGLQLAQALCGGEASCESRLFNEVAFMVLGYESQAQHQLNDVRALLKGLAGIPGHKTLVMMTGGVPTTVQPGARPDIASIDKAVGEEAQRSDTAIYALYVDWHRAQISSAEQRRAPRFTTAIAEDSALYRRSIDVFVGAAGGTLLNVLSGRGEAAFDQILQETSAYYVLGVEPAEADRDGKAKQLSVKVSQRGAIVHGSRWVTVPKRP